jgi:hypothetical protein
MPDIMFIYVIFLQFSFAVRLNGIISSKAKLYTVIELVVTGFHGHDNQVYDKERHAFPADEVYYIIYN